MTAVTDKLHPSYIDTSPKDAYEIREGNGLRQIVEVSTGRAMAPESIVLELNAGAYVRSRLQATVNGMRELVEDYSR